MVRIAHVLSVGIPFVIGYSAYPMQAQSSLLGRWGNLLEPK